jgi:hypothetical protein
MAHYDEDYAARKNAIAAFEAASKDATVNTTEAEADALREAVQRVAEAELAFNKVNEQLTMGEFFEVVRRDLVAANERYRQKFESQTKHALDVIAERKA